MRLESEKKYTPEENVDIRSVCGSKDNFLRSLRSRTGCEKLDDAFWTHWSRIFFIPNVQADSREQDEPGICSGKPPPRPPMMRYKELPLYDRPHWEYKTFMADLHKCPDCDVKVLHERLFPMVSSYRKTLEQTFCEQRTFFSEVLHELATDFAAKKKELKSIARHPDNFHYRCTFVTSATLLSYVCAMRKSGGLLSRGIFWGGVGATSSGWLCFPKETDAVCREISFTVLRFIYFAYNNLCKKDAKIIIGPCVKGRPDIPKEKPDLCKKK